MHFDEKSYTNRNVQETPARYAPWRHSMTTNTSPTPKKPTVHFQPLNGIEHFPDVLQAHIEYVKTGLTHLEEDYGRIVHFYDGVTEAGEFPEDIAYETDILVIMAYPEDMHNEGIKTFTDPLSDKLVESFQKQGKPTYLLEPVTKGGLVNIPAQPPVFYRMYYIETHVYNESWNDKLKLQLTETLQFLLPKKDADQ